MKKYYYEIDKTQIISDLSDGYVCLNIYEKEDDDENYLFSFPLGFDLDYDKFIIEDCYGINPNSKAVYEITDYKSGLVKIKNDLEEEIFYNYDFDYEYKFNQLSEERQKYLKSLVDNENLKEEIANLIMQDYDLLEYIYDNHFKNND